MHGILPTANLFTQAVSQIANGLANRASSQVKSFESDLQSGDMNGAQSFLTSLRQKLGTAVSTPAGAATSAQITQVSNDLTAGNLTAAQSDFSNLQLGLSAAKHRPGQPENRGSANPPAAISGTASSPSTASQSALAALQSPSVLQQEAFNSALNLSLPASLPSLSVNS